MKTREFHVPVLLLVFMLSAMLASPAFAEDLPGPGALSGDQALQLMQKLGKDLTVIDVRTEGEFAQGHVPGAILIPVESLQSQMDRVPVDKPVLLLCRTGRRAEAAYGIIRKERPQAQALWFLRASPVYHSDGTFLFK